MDWDKVVASLLATARATDKLRVRNKHVISAVCRAIAVALGEGKK